MARQLWSWRKKLTVLLLVIIAGYGGKQLLGLLMVRHLMMPEIYTFSSVAELEKEKVAQIERFLRIEIPKSARDIYYFRSGGKDRANLCSFILPAEENNKFTEEFVGVSLSQFHNLEDYLDKVSGISLVLRGPTIWGEKWKTPYWNIRDIYERCIYFETDRQFSGIGRSMIVDPDTNRVYICIH